jgi:SecD/SecF fusion protein
MKPFFWKIVICLVPNLLAGWVVFQATRQYAAGEGGFRLGVDLVGGTILVYEIDASKQKEGLKDVGTGPDAGSKSLAAYLKRRIDPNDLYNIVIRMVGDTRVEIILPTGGIHRSERAKEAWDEVIRRVKKDWYDRLQRPVSWVDQHKPSEIKADKKKLEEVFQVGQGKIAELADRIKKRIDTIKWAPLLSKKEIWDDLKEEAVGWNADPAEVDKIKPGDYEALIDLVRDQRRAVDKLRGLAQTKAWGEALERLKHDILKKKYKYDEESLKGLNGADFPPEKRELLVNFLQTRGDRDIMPTAVSAVHSFVGPVGPRDTPSADEVNKFLDDVYGPTSDDITASIRQHYKEAGGRRDVTTDYVQHVKEQIARVGRLEFLILANSKDDKEGVEAAKRTINDLREHDQDRLDKLQKSGEPPPGPSGTFLITTANGEKSRVSYSWVQVGPSYRKDLRILNSQTNSPTWQTVARARAEGKVAEIPDYRGGTGQNGYLYIYSRECKNQNLSEEEQRRRRFDYFILVRDPEIDERGEYVKAGKPKEVTGDYLSGVQRGQDQNAHPSVDFQFDSTGAQLFGDLTGKNVPDEKSAGGSFYRHLAIVLDGEVMSAPTINSRIESRGQITGDFTIKQVNDLVEILRSGALPATLKPQPVSESTMGATLGEDTIEAGVTSVGIAFAAVLLFMIVYYRFAGLVACVALLSNLLLTVGFMAAVQATFTLPGLAGLVLMLGMAVDANVLIYERLREERERGASLPLAIRNGYDRAFPTIIDTHLSSIFTAIVLYVVGNDQLKGFGITLTVGLIISLFTSLYMTRLLFDIWQNRGWLKKLSMFKLLSRPRIDFMAIRYYWFAATIILTVVGASLFIFRGSEGLNIDFVGGTAYGGRLVEAQTLKDLRDRLGGSGEANDPQKEMLRVDTVKEGTDQHTYSITYARRPGEDKPDTREIYINQPGGTNTAERQDDVKRRAQQLPDPSVELIFLRSDEQATSDRSRYFNVRTTEKEAQLVQAALDRLLQQRKNGKWESLLQKTEMDFTIPAPRVERFLGFAIPVTDSAKVQDARLVFTTENRGASKPAFASPSYVSTLLTKNLETFLKDERGLKPSELKSAAAFSLLGEGQTEESHYHTMSLTLATPLSRADFEHLLTRVKEEFNKRPQPERLENFDSALAAETRGRAILAIVLSWGALLLYLWFRFGNWTFGLAAVLCLIHDLFFTVGMLAFASFLHGTWIGNVLMFEDFKLDLTGVAALLTLVGYSVSDTIVVFDRIREVRGKNPDLTPQIINDSVNQTLSRTLLTAFSVFLVVTVLYIWGGPGVHLFAFVMVVGVVVGTYSSIYIASPLLLIFGEGHRSAARARQPQPKPAEAPV